jgi:hypothetical protein
MVPKAPVLQHWSEYFYRWPKIFPKLDENFKIFNSREYIKKVPLKINREKIADRFCKGSLSRVGTVFAEKVYYIT